MFLWVTDFYSLEKIISAFPKIVLLYLKMTGDRNRRVWGAQGGRKEGGRWLGGGGGICAVGKGREEKGFWLQVPKSLVFLSVLAADWIQSCGEDGG